MTGLCYQVLDIALTWAEAREECSYRGGWRRGGDLASINSLQEQTFMRTWLLSVGEVDSHWLGFSDQSAEGGWAWSDGSPVAYVDWADGEPNNYGNGEDCGEIVVGGLAGGGTWNDQKCDRKSKAICEKRGDNYVSPPSPPPPSVKCQEGWTEFESRCYYFSTPNANSWTEAAETCHNLNF